MQRPEWSRSMADYRNLKDNVWTKNKDWCRE